MEEIMNYSIKPEEHELQQAQQIVETAIDSSRHVLEKGKPFTVHLGHAAKVEVGEFGVFGKARDSENGQIYFNTSVESWKQNLNDLTLDIYGQSWFYEKVDSVQFVWQQLLANTTGLLLIDQISEGREPDYNSLQEEWSEKKEDLSEQLSIEKQENFSWQLKLKLGRKLLDSYELKEFPELKRSDVIEAGDETFL
jgi:hypothetical protein